MVSTVVVAAVGATIVVALTAAACWVIVRTRVPGRSLLGLRLRDPARGPRHRPRRRRALGYVGSPLPIYGTVAILVVAYLIRAIPYTMRFNHAGILGISRELEESAFVAGATQRREMLRACFVPLLLPALFAGWQYAFLQTARELPVALLLQSEGNRMVSVWIWNLWEIGQVTNAAALSIVVVVVLIGGLGWMLERISRRVGMSATGVRQPDHERGDRAGRKGMKPVAGEATLTVRSINKYYGGLPRRARRHLQHPRRRVLHAPRPFRLRQEHDPAVRRGPRTYR